ncbi:MAG: hypothetical protein EAZ70_02370 [Runella slithyformis]|nr:MAG: hypothetical protein EAY79_02020 [Runella slithyformis]TAF00924.1 MAG: hypothetical protein EAZ80_03400 [Runella slithyformis]TAF29304.1 MAG: hypothetical protein EAZ70_02370 [Runella slithyformis]TAF48321.1 MAG: hypothetical protein EAZ63_05385 [Runella slithyformis]TAF83207.1 MAG: hypothetical protein EAZ50_01760 [Runella slithyformis]
MKKNQTDDLFGRKLRQAEISPRPEAWEKLQARLQTEKRPLAWWQQRGPWLAAAGLSLLLITSWVVWKNQTPKQPAMAQNVPQQPKVNVEPKQEVAKFAQPNNNLAAATRVAETPHRSLPTNTKTPQNQPTSPEIKLENIAQQTKTIEPKPAPNVVETAPAAQPVVEVAQAQATPPSVEKTVVLQLPELPKVALGAKELADLPLIETTPVEDTRKGSRFARLFRQVKNAKEGQRVEWDEVGVNPNKILAKVTRRDNYK